MRAVAHGWKPDRMKGPPVKVAKEFVAADKKAKGYQFGGVAKRLLKEAQDKRTLKERMRDKYGTESLTLKQAMKRSGKKGLASAPTAVRELGKAGWTQSGKKWYPPQATATAPTEGGLAAAAPALDRTIQPIEGRQFISGSTPARQAARAPVQGTFDPARIPAALQGYLERQRAMAGARREEPVKAQYGGFMGRGRRSRGRRGQGRGMPPGGGLMTSDMGMRAGQARRGQMPVQELPMRGGRAPATPPMKGIGRAPSGGGPNMRAGVMPGGGQFFPGTGGAGTPGRPGVPPNLQGYLQMKRQASRQQQGSPRIGSGDQRGALARARQTQTGRPPISRRQPFPGRAR